MYNDLHNGDTLEDTSRIHRAYLYREKSLGMHCGIALLMDRWVMMGNGRNVEQKLFDYVKQ